MTLSEANVRVFMWSPIQSEGIGTILQILNKVNQLTKSEKQFRLDEERFREIRSNLSDGTHTHA